MLSQLSRLSVTADGRYATAEELQFLKDYFRSFNLRVSIYQKIKSYETEILRKAQAKLQQIDATIFENGSPEVINKWRIDTIRVLRYTSAALLFNEPNRLKEQFILWFQTVLKSLNVEDSAELTYAVMLEVINQYLTNEESAVFLPLWKLHRLKK